VANHTKCQAKRRELASKLARELEAHEATKKALREAQAEKEAVGALLQEELEALRREVAYLRARLRNATRTKPYDRPQRPMEVIELD
jgi:chromosome segregation ATPase